MSLFKERAANAKKVISLQNEIYSLKNQLKSQPQPADCVECVELEKSLKDVSLKNEQLLADLKSLKSDLKKSKSEITRLNKKLSSLDSDS